MEVLNDWRKDELKFLSNFSYAPTTIYNLLFKTNEHFYQWCKTLIPQEQDRIRAAVTPGQAKRLGQAPEKGGITTLRPNWHLLQDLFMEIGLWNKYNQHPDLSEKLVNTYPAYLIEGNYWHDNYWGDCWCKKCQHIEGFNKLGLMSMDIRDIKRCSIMGITTSGVFFPRDRKTLAVALPSINKGLPATYIEARDSDVIKPRAIAKYKALVQGEPYFAPITENSEFLGRSISEVAYTGVLQEWTFYNKF